MAHRRTVLPRTLEASPTDATSPGLVAGAALACLTTVAIIAYALHVHCETTRRRCPVRSLQPMDAEKLVVSSTLVSPASKCNSPSAFRRLTLGPAFRRLSLSPVISLSTNGSPKAPFLQFLSPYHPSPTLSLSDFNSSNRDPVLGVKPLPPIPNGTITRRPALATKPLPLPPKVTATFDSHLSSSAGRGRDAEIIARARQPESHVRSAFTQVAPSSQKPSREFVRAHPTVSPHDNPKAVPGRPFTVQSEFTVSAYIVGSDSAESKLSSLSVSDARPNYMDFRAPSGGIAIRRPSDSDSSMSSVFLFPLPPTPTGSHTKSSTRSPTKAVVGLGLELAATSLTGGGSSPPNHAAENPFDDSHVQLQDEDRIVEDEDSTPKPTALLSAKISRLSPMPTLVSSSGGPPFPAGGDPDSFTVDICATEPQSELSSSGLAGSETVKEDGARSSFIKPIVAKHSALRDVMDSRNISCPKASVFSSSPGANKDVDNSPSPSVVDDCTVPHFHSSFEVLNSDSVMTMNQGRHTSFTHNFNPSFSSTQSIDTIRTQWSFARDALTPRFSQLKAILYSTEFIGGEVPV